MTDEKLSDKLERHLNTVDPGDYHIDTRHDWETVTDEIISELKSLEAEKQKLRWHHLGCQGELDILPLIEAKEKAEAERDQLTKRIDELKGYIEEYVKDGAKILHRAESAEAEVKRLKEIIDSLTGDDKLAVINWKKLFDSYIELRDKNKDAESRLSKAQELPKKWRGEADELEKTGIDYDSEEARGINHCIDELEEALK